jgi:hypothetical protein
LTKPHSVMLTKKNGDIHPFEDPQSLEFLAGKNECGLVVFGTHSKKRPNNITLTRIYNSKVLDMAELLLLNSTEELQTQKQLQIGVEMKPLILFAGSQWDDDSSSDSAALYRTLKSLLLDLFQGEEISSIDVAGLQYVLMIASGESSNANPAIHPDRRMDIDLSDPSQKPVLHLRWYKIRTTRSDTPKIPRVELDPIGPAFDFRVGRSRVSDTEIWKEAMKHGRRSNEARTKKNIETDLVGDKLGRVHLGKQDLKTLQTRKMKGLKRSRDEDAESNGNGHINGGIDEDDHDDDDIVSVDDEMDGGIDIDDGDLSDGGSSIGGTGDEIDIGDSDVDMADAMPKRQRLA